MTGKQLKDKNNNNIFPKIEEISESIIKVNNSNADLYSGTLYKNGKIVTARLDFTIITPSTTTSYQLGKLPEGFIPSVTNRFDIPQAFGGSVENCRIYFTSDGKFSILGGVKRQTYITLTYLL